MVDVETKSLLRTQALARRSLLTPIEIQAFTTRIARIGGGFVSEKQVRSVAAYWPIKGEISPLLLLESLAQRKIATALPVMVGRDRPLVFRQWRPQDPLVAAKFGIKEPAPSAPEIDPEMLFVPLLAFDRCGRRLGYGGGFYDRTLAQLRAKGNIAAVGIAHTIQELPEIPVGDHDQNLDFVLTDREWIICRSGSMQDQ